MRALVANHSSYPDVTAGAALSIAAIVGAQEDAGADIVTDGHLGRELLGLASRLDGVRLGPAQPLFATGVHVRRPIVEAKLRRRQPLACAEVAEAVAAARRPVKAVLSGPHSFAALAEIRSTAYRHAAALAADFAELLADEVHDLAGTGAKAIQIDEPALLASTPDMRLIRELLEPIYDAAAGRAQIVVSVGFGDAVRLYAQLNSLPGDVIAVDVCSCPALIDEIAATGSAKPLALGLVDGRSLALEDLRQLGDALARALHRYVHAEIYLQPSCGLGALTPAQARSKLERLAAARDALRPPSSRAQTER